MNTCSALLPGSVMKSGSTLGPLSVVMKGEIIPSRTYWVGNRAYAMHGSLLSCRNGANEWSVLQCKPSISLLGLTAVIFHALLLFVTLSTLVIAITSVSFFKNNNISSD